MKEKDYKTIWEVPKYLPNVQPTLTDELITKAENKIGYKLPKEYLELLRIQNGGYIRFTLKDTQHREILGIGPYYPSLTDFEWLHDDYSDLSFEVKDLFPFDGDGHWFICLDYRRNKVEPEITYIDTETDTERPIAANFKEYLGLLEIETNNKFVIETDVPIDSVLRQISNTAKIKFEEPDYWTHGYAVYRSNYRDNWIWVSPNIAPSGFIRDDHERYDELKSEMETTDLRYPELSASSLLLSVSDDNKQIRELFKTLTTNGLKIRPLIEYL